MSQFRWLSFVLFLAFIFVIGVSPAAAVITRLTPVKSIIDDSDQIALVKVEAIDPDRPSMTLTLMRDLKGEAAVKRWPILLKGSNEGEGKIVLDRVTVGSPMILFITKQETQWLVNAYFSGTWIQIIGTQVEGSPRWALTHGEPYLRRTFSDTTEAMTLAIDGYLKDGAAPPAVRAQDKPGYGQKLDGTIEAWSDAKATTNDASKITTPSPIAVTPSVPSVPSSSPPPSNESLMKPWLLIALGIIIFIVLALLVRKKSQ